MLLQQRETNKAFTEASNNQPRPPTVHCNQFQGANTVRSCHAQPQGTALQHPHAPPVSPLCHSIIAQLILVCYAEIDH